VTDALAKRAYSVPEAAAAVSQSEATIRRALHSTDPTAFPPPLSAKRAGKKLLIPATELDRWVASLPNA
jgi:hypothetical protein